MELDCYTYRVLLKDSIIHKLRQTENGVDYLENAWILRQTSPDRSALRNKFKKGSD